jgi:predicted RNA-binding Zn-ribbon protein involved in translation (DUF1610 family)
MTRIIRVITARNDTVTLVHDGRKVEFPCPRCGQMLLARPGARCADCGARVDSVQETYPLRRKRRPPSNLPQPSRNKERDGMLGCLYGLYLRSRGLAPAEALKLVRERYPHLEA